MRARKFPGSDNAFNGIKLAAADTTLTNQDANKIIEISTTTATIVTLPPVSQANKGAKFHIKMTALAGSGGHQVKPVSVDKLFVSFASSTAASDGKKLYFGSDASGTADKVGDYIVLQSDGVDGYHEVSGSGSFFREA